MTAASDKIKADLDALISWYEKFKKPTSNSIQVNCTKTDARHFCDEGDNGEYRYRGYIIVPLLAMKRRKTTPGCEA